MRFTITFRWPITVSRHHTATDYRVLIYNPGTRKIPVIKALRTFSGYTLKHAKEIVCDTEVPAEAAGMLSEADARRLVAYLTDAGAEARMERHEP